MGRFKVSKITNLKDVTIGQEFQESDFSAILENGEFVQMTYEEEDVLEKYEVKPGIWKIVKTAVGMRLVSSAFSKDEILESFINTKELETKIDCFFRNLETYKKLKRQTPKRACLLWGPPGTGKTASSVHVANKYVTDFPDTCVIIWNTDALDPYEVKSFVQQFSYKGVERMILIAEDLGGVEMEQVKMKSMASLLSILDNKEQTFTVPVFIIATTNFPESFLSNITNRPQRIDDKIHVPNPTGPQRQQLFQFFIKNFEDKYTKEQVAEINDLLLKEKYKEFSIAHLEDVIVQSQIYELPLTKTLENIRAGIDLFNKEFQTGKAKLGFGMGSDDD